VDLRPNPFVVGGELIDQLVCRRKEVGLLETVRIRRDRGVGTVRDPVERDGRTHVDHLDRIDDLIDGVDPHLSAAVADVGVTDVVQEGAFPFVIEARVGVVQIGLEQNPAPVAGRGSRGGRIGVAPHGFVQPGREVHAFARRPQDL